MELLFFASFFWIRPVSFVIQNVMEHNTSLMTCNFLLSSSLSLTLSTLNSPLYLEKEQKIKTCFQTPRFSLTLTLTGYGTQRNHRVHHRWPS